MNRQFLFGGGSNGEKEEKMEEALQKTENVIQHKRLRDLNGKTTEPFSPTAQSPVSKKMFTFEPNDAKFDKHRNKRSCSFITCKHRIESNEPKYAAEICGGPLHVWHNSPFCRTHGCAVCLHYISDEEKEELHKLSGNLYCYVHKNCSGGECSVHKVGRIETSNSSRQSSIQVVPSSASITSTISRVVTKTKRKTCIVCKREPKDNQDEYRCEEGCLYCTKHRLDKCTTHNFPLEPVLKSCVLCDHVLRRNQPALLTLPTCKLQPKCHYHQQCYDNCVDEIPELRLGLCPNCNTGKLFGKVYFATGEIVEENMSVVTTSSRGRPIKRRGGRREGSGRKRKSSGESQESLISNNGTARVDKPTEFGPNIITDAVTEIEGEYRADINAELGVHSAAKLPSSTLLDICDTEMLQFTEPSLPRRTTRFRQSPIRFDEVNVKKIWNFEPVTHKCHQTHVGIGCASKQANHMPQYYNSLKRDGVIQDCNCPYCKAILLPSESVGVAAYSKCCAKGRVHLENKLEELSELPLELEFYLHAPNPQIQKLHDALIKDPMTYNDSLAFGHPSIQPEKGRYDHRIIKCNNMIEYVLWDYNRPAGELQDLLRGQLFTVDSDEAENRLDHIAEDKEIDPVVLKTLYHVLKQHHWMAKTYKIASEIFEEQDANNRLRLRISLIDTRRTGAERVIDEESHDLQPVDLASKLDPADQPHVQQIHPGRLGIPTPEGAKVLAQIYLDTGENVTPYKRGIVLKGRAGTGQVHLSWWNRNVDPALFPLIFPKGQFGYEDNLKLTLRPNEKFDEAIHDIIDKEKKAVVDADEELGQGVEFLGELEKFCQRRDRISRTQWFRFLSQIRSSVPGDWRTNHWLWDWGKLSQLYTISFNQRMEADKVRYYKIKQSKTSWVRSEALKDWILKKLDQQKVFKGTLGKIFMTDKHFRGSKQYYRDRYSDAMTMFRKKGSPDLMITFTMDPDCDELSTMMKAGQRWYNRPDLVCRLFIDKLDDFKKELTERECMGPISAWLYSIEHQKRGLPHVHFLISLDWERLREVYNISTPEDYMEQYISAEIPDKPDANDRTEGGKLQRELFKTITIKNIHTCSTYCLDETGKCTKRFPKPYSPINMCPEGSYPICRRRPPCTDENIRKQNPDAYGNYIPVLDKNKKPVLNFKNEPKIIGNCHVVSYNHYLTSRYKAHINVEMIAGAGCLKYVVKYVMKGADMAFVEAREEGSDEKVIRYDEFHQLRLARFVSSMEAYLSLWGVPLVHMSHTVTELPVHGAETVRVPVKVGELEEAEDIELAKKLEEVEGVSRISKLTAYFEYNQKHPGLNLTYDRLHERLRWNEKDKKWQKYKPGYERLEKLCRLQTVSPANRELLSIRLLLFHVKDPQSFDDLKGEYNTFVEAARARGLLENEQMWKDTVRDAFSVKTGIGQRIRWLAVFFATTSLPNPTELFNDILGEKAEWLNTKRFANMKFEEKRQYVLQSLEWFLRAHGVQPDVSDMTACEYLHLPRPENFVLSNEQEIKMHFFPDDAMHSFIEEEKETFGDTAEGLMRKDDHKKNWESDDKKPNQEQAALIEEIYCASYKAKQLMDKTPGRTADFQRCFFVTGEGGSGKTYAFNKLISRLKGDGFNVLPMATTGIASELLFNGTTVHSKICRCKHVDSTTPYPDREYKFAEMLRQAHVLIIDEVSMTHRDVLEYVDRCLRYVCKDKTLESLPFAGKVVVCGGDWKQLLPVIIRGGPIHQYNASLKHSYLWETFADGRRRLMVNHRLSEGQERYRTFLKGVGTGILNRADDRVRLLDEICMHDRDKMMDFVFPQRLLDDPKQHSNELKGRAILCTKNSTTLEINNEILDRMYGKERIYEGVTQPIPEYKSTKQRPVSYFDVEQNRADYDYENLKRMTPSACVPEHNLRIKKGAIMMITVNLDVGKGLTNGKRVQIIDFFDHCILVKPLSGKGSDDVFPLFRWNFEFGIDPEKAEKEGVIPCVRVQFPLRPGSAMTINKSQGQTLDRVGVLLDREQCFGHGQLYVALSRVRTAESIQVVTKNTKYTRNIVEQQILDPEDLEEALKLDYATLYKSDEKPSDNISLSDSTDSSVSSWILQYHQGSVFASPSASPPTKRIKNLNLSVNKAHVDKIRIVRKSIAYLVADVLVNTISNNPDVTFLGVSNAIRFAMDPDAQKYEAELDEIWNKTDISEGEVVFTNTHGHLKADGVNFIFHVVAPVIHGTTVTEENRNRLQNCYKNALTLMKDKEQCSIVFPCISIGRGKYPCGRATNAAVEAILNWLSESDENFASVDFITICTIQKDMEKLYRDYLKLVRREISSNRSSSSFSSRSSRSSTSSRGATRTRDILKPITPKTPRKEIVIPTTDILMSNDETPTATPMKKTESDGETPMAKQLHGIALVTPIKKEEPVPTTSTEFQRHKQQPTASHFPLSNLNNDCFANSVIQTLRHIKEIRNSAQTFAALEPSLMFKRDTDEGREMFNTYTLLNELGKVLVRARQDCRAIRSTTIIKCKQDPRGQQDPMEFLQLLMQQDNEILDLRRLFSFETVSTMTCDHCYKSSSPRTDSDIALRIAVKNGPQTFDSIIIRGANSPSEHIAAWKCDCGRNGGIQTTTFNVDHTPYLILEFKAYSYDERTRQDSKKSPVITGFNVTSEKILAKRWKAFASIIHRGPSRKSGHYFAYCFDNDNGQWVKHEDTFAPVVVQSPFVDVRASAKDECTYLLFMKKIDEPEEQMEIEEPQQQPETEPMEIETVPQIVEEKSKSPSTPEDEAELAKLPAIPAEKKILRLANSFSFLNLKPPYYPLSFINVIIQVLSSIEACSSPDLTTLEYNPECTVMAEIANLLHGKTKSAEKLQKLLLEHEYIETKVRDPKILFEAVMNKVRDPFGWRALFVLEQREVYNCQECGTTTTVSEAVITTIYPQEGQSNLTSILPLPITKSTGRCKKCNDVCQIRWSISAMNASYVAICLDYERSPERKIKPTFVNYNVDSQNILGYKWRMIAAIFHSPLTTRRHYYAYVRMNNHWLKLEDDKPPKERIQMKDKLRRAYLLFYQKVQKNTTSGLTQAQSIEKPVHVQHYQVLCAEQHYELPSNAQRIRECLWNGKRDPAIRNMNPKLPDVIRLKGEEWLSDRIIDAYLELIQAKYTTKTICILDSYFNTAVLSKKSIEEVRRILGRSYMKKTKSDKEILGYDMVILPVHVDRDHWILVVIQPKAKELIYYDPLVQRSYDQSIFNIKSLMSAICSSYTQQHEDWPITKLYNPGQLNSFDCGVYVCIMAEHLAAGRSSDYIRASDLQFFRFKILCELVTQKFCEYVPGGLNIVPVEHPFESKFPSIFLIKADITTVNASVIVNAANQQLQKGGGIDDAIHVAAGPGLQKALSRYRGCATGDCVQTAAFQLKFAKTIIHAVGPRIQSGARPTVDEIAKLGSCYEKALSRARGANMRSIAFPCISTGIYNFPNELAAETALNAVFHWMGETNNEEWFKMIIFCVYAHRDYEIYKRLLFD